MDKPEVLRKLLVPAPFVLGGGRWSLFGVRKKVQMSGVQMLLLLLLAAGVGATNQTQFFAVGDAIKLSLFQHTGRIDRILWKRDPNIVADWTGGVYRSYGMFKGRTAVDNTTGLLEIKAGTAGDSGWYRVEVNDQLQDTVYHVKVIEPVPKPTVWLLPLSCSPSSLRCDLRCDGSTDKAEPVTYSWTWGDEGWTQQEKVLVITNSMAKSRTFSCRMQNPVSHQESDPRDNPFFQDENPSTVSKVLAGVLVPIGLLIILGLVIYRCRDKIQGYLRGDGHTQVNQEEGDIHLEKTAS